MDVRYSITGEYGVGGGVTLDGDSQLGHGAATSIEYWYRGKIEYNVHGFHRIHVKLHHQI
jgi:hypothetical protein